MRSADEMLDLIVGTAEDDARIRAVILNGSRADPHSETDVFQDFDIVYIVSEVTPFREDRSWIERFGELMILQIPDAMEDPPPLPGDRFTYLMQFTDGNRIDLTLHPVDRLPALDRESLSVLLLDKDGILTPFPPPGDSDHLPKPPEEKEFSDCCNEFWWVCPYVAKGLWRREMTYARHMLDGVLRNQLMRMLDWFAGMNTGFTKSTGKFGKHLERILEPRLWTLLMDTYSDSGYESTWNSLLHMCALFGICAAEVGEHLGFEYPQGDDDRVSAHLRHVRALPSDAGETY